MPWQRDARPSSSASFIQMDFEVAHVGGDLDGALALLADDLPAGEKNAFSPLKHFFFSPHGGVSLDAWGGL